MEQQQHIRLLRRFEEQQKQLMEPADPAFLAGLAMFSGVPERARLKVAEKVARFMHVVEYAPGTVILEMGRYSDSAYFVVEGTVEVTLAGAAAEAPAQAQVVNAPKKPERPEAPAEPDAPGEGGATRIIRRGQGPITGMLDAMVPPSDVVLRRIPLGPGEIFGELGALSRYPVSATVIATTTVKVVRMQARGLRTLSMTSKEFKAWLDTRYRERALANHLRQVPMFDALDDAFVEALRKKVELISFEGGQLIVQEGAAADSLLLIRGGYVKVCVRAGTSELAVTYLRKGDCAGESALLLDERWPFTLRALESVEVVKITRSDFRALLGRFPAVEDALWERSTELLKDRGAALRQPVSSGYLQMAMDTGLIHGESVLLIDLTTCTRCDECVRGCADAHAGEPRFVRAGYRYRNWLVPIACYQCTDPTCMVDCPTGAITREFGDLVVTINPTDHATRPCIGCGNCANRCPWGNIVMVEHGVRPDGKPQEQATKCDLCFSRPDGPACVQMCPQGSAVRVSFREVSDVLRTLRKD